MCVLVTVSGKHCLYSLIRDLVEKAAEDDKAKSAHGRWCWGGNALLLLNASPLFSVCAFLKVF